MRRRVAPYSVWRSVVKPGSRPYIFCLEVEPGAVEAVGVLERVAGAFARRRVPIIQLRISTLGRPRILLVADLKGREELAGELVDALRGVDYVADAWYAPPITDGVAVDECSFPLVFMGDRVVMLRRPVYEGFIAGGWERLGSGYGQLLYIVGFAAGQKAYERQLSAVDGSEELVRLAKALFQMLGYGRIELLRIDDARREAVVRVYDSFECELFRGAGEIRGNFIRGLIAGWLAARWHVERLEEVTAREVKCIARGDPYCQYWIRAEAKA